MEISTDDHLMIVPYYILLVELPVFISSSPFLGMLSNFQESLQQLANQETPGALLSQSEGRRSQLVYGCWLVYGCRLACGIFHDKWTEAPIDEGTSGHLAQIDEGSIFSKR